MQLAYTNWDDGQNGTVPDWVLFLNQYFYLQNLVDYQIGLILDALAASTFANNKIIIFLSDHGEYGGSHGMHTKAFAVYEEAIRVPFYVQFPGQPNYVAMNQMCSSVDFFGLICDLGNPATTANTSEMGNDYTNPALQTKIAQYTQVLGSLGSTPTGLAASELSRPLIGTGNDGNPLADALATA